MATDPRTIINTNEDPGLVNPTGYVPSQSATNGTTEVKSVTINYTDPPLYGVPELQIFNDPGGRNGAVQFNVGNRLGGDSNFVWNSKNRTLSILGNIRISDSIIGKYNTNTKNLKITGGEDGYVLSTDGTGNISWIPAPSTTYGNSNVANYLPTHTGNVSANYFIGNGSQLTGLPTQYANSNVANYLPTYTGNLNGNSIIITDTGYIYNISSTGLASLTTVNVSSNLTTNAIYTDNYFYANGNVVPIGGTVNFGFNYYVNPSNANLAGTMTPDSNTAANVTYIDFNPVDDNGVDLDTTMTFFTGKYVNVTVNDQANSAVSATYSVSQVTPVLTSYLGYNAVYTRQWGDDPAISKIAIFKDDSTASTLTYPDTNNDTFTIELSPKVSGPLSDQMALIVLWTQDDSEAPSTTQLQEYFEEFVDTVLSPAGGVIGTVRENFYGNINPLTTIVQSWGTNTPFNVEFFTNSVESFYNAAAQTSTSGAGTGFTADVIIRGDGTYEINGWFGGIDYQTGDTITIDGASLGGVTTTNDLTLTVAGVVGSAGEVLGFTDLTGTNAGIWPDYGITDGGSDIYDDGNFLQTNQVAKVPYSNGTVQNTGAFGSNEWFVGYAYGQFIFVGDNTGDAISSFGTYGETGADGVGERETGNLSPAEYYRMTVNSVLAYNSGVNFSNESEWNVVFDIAGARTNGVEFSQTQARTITTNTGDLTITAADDITVQPYNRLNLYGGDAGRGLRDEGGEVNIQSGNGSDAVDSVGASQNAGGGGTLNISAGSAGNNDGNVSLSGDGGDINMTAGSTDGDGNGGDIVIRGGYVFSGNGNGGDVSVYGGQGSGTGRYGNIILGSNNYSWRFDYTGNLTLPANTFAVNYANGTSVSLGGDNNTGNVTFDDVTIQGDNSSLKLSSGPLFTADSAYLQVRAGDFANHIHFDTGNNEAYDLIIGNDQKYVQVSSTGNILMSSYDGNVSHEWNLDNTGNLTLPNGGSLYSAPAPIAGNMIVINPHGSGAITNQQLMVYPTVGDGDHIHMATGNLYETELFLGTDDFYVKLANTGNVVVNSNDGIGNAHSWTFDKTGNLTIPGTSGGLIKTVANASIGIVAIDDGTDNPAQLMSWRVGQFNPNTIISTYTNSATVMTDVNGTIKIWSFDNTGTLTLPGNTFAVNYANGTQVSLGGSYSNSDVANYLPTYTGNVSANYFIGDGSLLTGLPTATVTQDITSNGAMSIMTYDGNLKYVSYATVEPSSGNIAGGNISTTGNVSANYFIGNGAILTYITGSNVNGNVTSAVQSHYANIANSVAGSNVSGQVGNSLISGTVYTNAQPNITSVGTLTSLTISGNVTANNLGNISIINLDGNSSNVLYGNGVFVAAPSGGSSSYGNSNVATFLASFGSNTISTTGNVSAGNAILTGTSVTGVNSILAGPTFTPLANTMAGFVSNVNSYTQLTIQNKSTGADATTDFVATANNGNDTVNYLDLGIINSGYDNGTPTNSLGNIVYAADSYIYAQGNTSATGQSGGNLAIGTTVASKTVKIFAGGVTSNSIVASFANTGANITGNLNVSGNITGANISGNISITGNIQGTSSNVSLVAGSYTMTFDNTGILTLPRMGGDEGGEINLGIPATNTTLTSRVVVDVFQDRLRFFDGSTKGAYIDLSQATSGVGTLLNNRVSGLVNAGTFVTMDLIKATVTTSGNRGLSLATTTGTFAYSIGGTYGMATPASGGSAGTGTLTTTATASIFNWGFVSTGDTSTYILTDTTNSRAYRITLQIGGSFNNNMISIERLI